MGVIAPARSQPRGSPLDFSRPAWTCAARRLGGEVLASTAKPNSASLVAGTGALMLAGSNGNVWPRDRPFGSIFVASEPVAEKSPRNGDGIPPNESHGEPAFKLCKEAAACAAVTGVGLLPPS